MKTQVEIMLAAERKKLEVLMDLGASKEFILMQEKVVDWYAILWLKERYKDKGVA